MVVMSYINPDLVSNMDETPVPDLPWYGVMISTLLIVPMIIYFANSYRNSSLPDSQET